MKNRLFKTTLELFGLQIFFGVLSVFFVEFFSWIDGWKWLYSAFTGWLFLGAVHSTFWQMGNKDYKNNIIANNHIEDGQESIKLSMCGGFKNGSLYFGINVFVVLLTFIFNSFGRFGDIMFLIHRILLLPLAGFIPETGGAVYWLVCLILCIVMYIPCITAYISGAHNFSLIEKIVPKIIYKSSKKKD